MNILLTSMSRYPARWGGNGSSRVHDVLAKGLAELGHAVHYSVSEGYAAALPKGVIACRRNFAGADIHHYNDYPFWGAPPPAGTPWIRTFHAPYEPQYARYISDHFVFVSRAHAETFGSPRYVWNGIDPDEVVYSGTKEDYFLFIVSELSRAESKGLPIAVAVAERLGARLLVGAKLDADPSLPPFASPNVTYLGEIRHARKADLLAGARALLFPTQLDETFGLVAVEALMSGTPVIGSTRGALPEIITTGVGFTCDTLDEYVAAATRIDRIAPEACRHRAMTEFHYHVMTRRYVDEYEREIALTARTRSHSGAPRPALRPPPFIKFTLP